MNVELQTKKVANCQEHYGLMIKNHDMKLYNKASLSFDEWEHKCKSLFWNHHKSDLPTWHHSHMKNWNDIGWKGDRAASTQYGMQNKQLAMAASPRMFLSPLGILRRMATYIICIMSSLLSQIHSPLAYVTLDVSLWCPFSC